MVGLGFPEALALGAAIGVLEARINSRAIAFLAKANTAALKNTAVEDLAWVAINKVDFLFSY